MSMEKLKFKQSSTWMKDVQDETNGPKVHLVSLKTHAVI
jgi:hypothetical protein